MNVMSVRPPFSSLSLVKTLEIPMLSDARRCIPDAQSVFALQRGGCSTVDWAERIADAVPHRQEPVVYVNVGANKGYRVPEFLALWSQRPVPGHMKAWQEHLLRYAGEHNFKFLKVYSCGNCADCKGRLPAQWKIGHTLSWPSRPTAVSVDPVPADTLGMPSVDPYTGTGLLHAAMGCIGRCNMTPGVCSTGYCGTGQLLPAARLRLGSTRLRAGEQHHRRSLRQLHL